MESNACEGKGVKKHDIYIKPKSYKFEFFGDLVNLLTSWKAKPCEPLC